MRPAHENRPDQLERCRARIAARLAAKLRFGEEDQLPECEIFLHAEVDESHAGNRFQHVAELTREIFPQFQRLVYIAPVGLVVRAVAPCLQHKTTDPGVVVVDVGGRWAVSLVGGHEGGANDLALAVANALGAEPVVTTSTEAAKDLIVGIGCRRGTAAETIVAAVQAALAAAGCPLDRVRLLATAELKADEAGLREAARRLHVPLRWIADEEIRATTRAFATFAPGTRESRSARRCRAGSLVGGKEDPITTPQDQKRRRHGGDRPGRLYAVGIGPGGREHRTFRAVEAIGQSEVVVGYRRYLELIADLTAGKEVISSGMTEEVQRCRLALKRAAEGRTVALVSSGDAGIYGMAGLAMELAEAEKLAVAIEVIPGVTAASAAAAALGAPLMLDFAAVSLSDLLVPWETIRRRLEAVAAADLVAALYNPRSARRTRPWEEAVAIFRAARRGSTPVGIVTAAGQPRQAIALTDLDHLLDAKVGMTSTVIIGNSDTRLLGGRMVTARGYRL